VDGPVTSIVEMPASRRSERVTAVSHTSIEPHGRHGKSSEPTNRSWRAGMHGSEPAWWFVKRTARAASRSRFGVSNSVPP